MSFVAGDTPTLGTLLELAFERWERQAHVAFPAKVLKYDTTEHTVEIEPQHFEVWREGDERRAEPLPAIPNVPVLFPRASGYALYIPPTAGDYVLCLCTKYSLDRWRETGRAGDPGDMRRFTLDGCVAIPGLFPNPQVTSPGGVPASTATFVIPDGEELHIGKKSPDSFIGLANLISDELTAIKNHLAGIECDNGTISVSPPSAEYTEVGSVASTKVKSE